jgi:hypothetical protein
MLLSMDSSIFRFQPGGNVSDLLPRCTVVYIVRVWTEYLTRTPPSWRGEIERADTKEVKRFQALEEVTEYLQQNTKANPEPIEKEAF